MLTSFADILPPPHSGRMPVCAFTCYGLEAAVGVLRAAERRNVPVILLTSAETYRSPLGRPLLQVLRALGEAAVTPVALQLDHVSDLKLIAAALEDGVQSVMADGSKLGYNDNLEFVRAACDLAERHDAYVEAELGHVAGDEDQAGSTASSGYTDPSEAATFALDSGACCLAVSIGNVHGKYASPPELDVTLLHEIEARTNIPLALHGASGLPPEQLSAVLGGAIAKINVNTELRQRYFDVLIERLPVVTAGLDLLSLGSELVTAMADTAGAKLDIVAQMAKVGGVR